MKIANVVKTHMGHLHLDFDDGTSHVLPRGEHEKFQFAVGDEYPPAGHPESLSVQKVAEIRPRSDGHHNVVLEDGTTRFIERGKKVPRVGEEHVEHMVPL
jgi:hypothetical protein